MLIALSSCKKEVEEPQPIEQSVTYPIGNYPSGFGSSQGTPVCSPFVLPSNIVYIGEIFSHSFKVTNFNKETDNIDDFITTPKSNFIVLGSGSLVNVYIKFFNTRPQQSILIIPAGLVFSCIDTTAQTGIIVQPDTVIIPGNDTIGINLKCYCTNLHKHVPSNTNFKLSGITLHKDFNTLIGILKNKKKLSQGSQLQSIIWHITDAGGLTDADITYLNNLP